MQADMKQDLGDYKSAATAYKRAIAEAPAAELGLLQVSQSPTRLSSSPDALL